MIWPRTRYRSANQVDPRFSASGSHLKIDLKTVACRGLPSTFSAFTMDYWAIAAGEWNEESSNRECEVNQDDKN